MSQQQAESSKKNDLPRDKAPFDANHTPFDIRNLCGRLRLVGMVVVLSTPGVPESLRVVESSDLLPARARETEDLGRAIAAAD